MKLPTNRWLIIGLYVLFALSTACEFTEQDSRNNQHTPFGEPLPLDSSISSNTTLAPHDGGFPHYVVTGTISITNTLTIEPGTVIVFDNDAGLRIRDNGVIIAEGTEDEPIEFLGLSETPGFWKGILIESSNPNNKFDYVNISHAGSSAWFSWLEGASLTLNTARFNLSNSTIQKGAAYGITMAESASLVTFENNMLLENENGPVYAFANNIGGLDSLTDYGDKPVFVDGGSVEESQTWKPISTYYYVNKDLRIQDGTLTVEPGVEMRFGSDVVLRIFSDAIIAFEGTEEEPIQFIGDTNMESFWKGVVLESGNPTNRMDYVYIAHGGSSKQFSWMDEAANLTLNDAQLNLTNSTFSTTAATGIYLTEKAKFSGFSANSFDSVGTSAMNLSAASIDALDEESDFGDFAVHVRGISVEDDQSMAAISSYYEVEGEIRWQDGTLTIEPGANLVFQNDAGIRIYEDAKLVAVGTANAPINFVGQTAMEGFWKGILIESMAPDNHISHATISHTGSSKWTSYIEIASIGMNRSQLTVDNTVFSDSSGYAIWGYGENTLTESDNEFNGMEVVIED